MLIDNGDSSVIYIDNKVIPIKELHQPFIQDGPFLIFKTECVGLKSPQFVVNYIGFFENIFNMGVEEESVINDDTQILNLIRRGNKLPGNKIKRFNFMNIPKFLNTINRHLGAEKFTPKLLMVNSRCW